VVGPDDIVSHKLEDSADGLSDDGASEMADVHLLGDVGGREIDDNFLFLYLGEGAVEDQIVYAFFNIRIFQFYLKKSLLVCSN
jgi:hypothetical protein